MKHPSRLAYLLVLLVVWAASTALPGHAQQPSGGRYLFADTTLLRDTLNLHFTELFPLADSLGVKPDTLRSLSIRYRMPLSRVVFLADSFHVIVDSLGSTLEREHRNLLAATGRRVNTFHYSSGYDIQQNSDTWSNSSDYNFLFGPYYLRNSTTISQYHYPSGDGATRTSVTEGQWKGSPLLSLGGRVSLTINRDQASKLHKTASEYKFWLASTQKPMHGLTSVVNFFPGPLHVTSQLSLPSVQSTVHPVASSYTNALKHGVSGDLNGRVGYQPGWIAADFGWQVTGDLSRSDVADTSSFKTNSLSHNLTGSFGLLPSGPVGLRLEIQFHRTSVPDPIVLPLALEYLGPDSVITDTVSRPVLERKVTTTNSVQGILRVPTQSNDRYVEARLGSTHTSRDNNDLVDRSVVLGAIPADRLNGSRNEVTGSLAARYRFSGWTFEGHFSNSRARESYPTNASRDSLQADVISGRKRRVKYTSGYADRIRAPSIDGSLDRTFGTHFTFRATGRVSLTAGRYSVLGPYPSLQPDNDNYQQGYRVEGNYTRSEALTTSAALGVSRTVNVYLTPSSASQTLETRTYRAEWNWTDRLLPGLTATQANSIDASYVLKPYLSLEKDDRATLKLGYHTGTTLNAVLTQRFTANVIHDYDMNPNGNYKLAADGKSYFFQLSQTRTYRLRCDMTYALASGLSLVVSPSSSTASTLESAQSGGPLVLKRQTRTSSVSGGLNLGLTLGSKTRLNGVVQRREDANGQTDSGRRTSVRTDYWSASLNLTWDM